MKLPMQRKPGSGFTLIELLVVIAIIAILAAILFPVFAQARKKAYQATGGSNAKQAALAILQYVQDYDEKYPRAGWGCANASSGGPAFSAADENSCGATEWQNVTQPYTKNTGLYQNPGDASSANFDWGSDMHSNDGHFSMLINDLLSHTTATKSNGFADADQGQEKRADGFSLAAVQAPADCVLLMEGHCGWNKVDNGQSNSAGAHGPAANGINCSGPGLESKLCKEQTVSGFQTALFCPHAYNGASYVNGLPFYFNGGQVAFTDGHVKFVRYTDSAGNPILCSSLPWTKSIDPQQRGADRTADYCGGANPPGQTANEGNWN